MGVVLGYIGTFECDRAPWLCRAPNLGFSMHPILVPRSVSDMHNSNKVISKTILLLLMGKTSYKVWIT
jgi:hypothetical protein